MNHQDCQQDRGTFHVDLPLGSTERRSKRSGRPESSDAPYSQKAEEFSYPLVAWDSTFRGFIDKVGPAFCRLNVGMNADVPARGLRHDCVERAFMLATPAFVPVFGAR